MKAAAAPGRSHDPRRTEVRFDRQVDLLVEVEGGGTIIGRTRNLSLGGAFIETAEPLLVGARVQLSLRVPGAPDPIGVVGEVRWLERATAQGPGGAGVRFEGLRARDVWVLSRFLRS